MSDRVFIDTNILVYSSLNDEISKHDQSVAFIVGLKGNSVFVSTQVLSELYVAFLKHGVEEKRIVLVLTEISKAFNVSAITLETVTLAWNLKERHRFSYWDSLIVASALECGCTTLFTEDMQHGQVIAAKMKIMNPIG